MCQKKKFTSTQMLFDKVFGQFHLDVCLGSRFFSQVGSPKHLGLSEAGGQASATGRQGWHNSGSSEHDRASEADGPPARRRQERCLAMKTGDGNQGRCMQ